jgi:hypothetical protein
MPRHITNRTWMPEDLSSLEAMVKSGASATRAAAAFRRTIASVKIQAKKLGCPFPDERLLKRKRRSQLSAEGAFY